MPYWAALITAHRDQLPRGLRCRHGNALPPAILCTLDGLHLVWSMITALDMGWRLLQQQNCFRTSIRVCLRQYRRSYKMFDPAHVLDEYNVNELRAFITAVFLRLGHHAELTIKVLARSKYGAQDTQIEQLIRKIDHRNSLGISYREDNIAMPIRSNVLRCSDNDMFRRIRRSVGEHLAQSVVWEFAGRHELDALAAMVAD